MPGYSVAEAKAHLSAVLDEVEAGAQVTITKRGVPIALISPVHTKKGSINWQRIRQCQARMPALEGENWAQTLRDLREAERY